MKPKLEVVELTQVYEANPGMWLWSANHLETGQRHTGHMFFYKGEFWVWQNSPKKENIHHKIVDSSGGQRRIGTEDLEVHLGDSMTIPYNLTAKGHSW